MTAEESKNVAYHERNLLVRFIASIYPAWLERHPESDTAWENDWRWIVFVELPAGQCSWHIHDSERALFDGLAVCAGNSWDGHTTEEKYERVSGSGGIQSSAAAERMRERAADVCDSHASCEGIAQRCRDEIRALPLEDK